MESEKPMIPGDEFSPENRKLSPENPTKKLLKNLLGEENTNKISIDTSQEDKSKEQSTDRIIISLWENLKKEMFKGEPSDLSEPRSINALHPLSQKNDEDHDDMSSKEAKQSVTNSTSKIILSQEEQDRLRKFHNLD